MDLRQLHYFVTIAEERQITAAAKRLNMAQPPLSKQMQLLETEIGSTLFSRGPRQIRLTDAGQILYIRAKQLLALADSTEREMADFKSGRRGTLRIGTVSSSGSVLFNGGVEMFRRQYPNVRFEIYDGNTFNVIDWLHKGIIEIGIVRTPFDDAPFGVRRLPAEPMIAAMTAAFDEEPGEKTIAWPLLAKKPLIIYRRFAKLLRQSWLRHDLEPTILCRNDDARTTILWANAGLGVAIIPASAFSLAEHDQLRAKVIDDATLYTSIAVAWPKDRYLSCLAQAFIDSLSLE